LPTCGELRQNRQRSLPVSAEAFYFVASARLTRQSGSGTNPVGKRRSRSGAMDCEAAKVGVERAPIGDRRRISLKCSPLAAVNGSTAQHILPLPPRLSLDRSS
jgi:hypothetical protein